MPDLIRVALGDALRSNCTVSTVRTRLRTGSISVRS
jgi:hypothetical protein